MSGKTEDGKLVISNVFILTTSITGLSLEDTLMFFKEKGFLVDWIEYYLDAMEANWKPNRTMIRIKTSLTEVYDEEYCNEVMRRLEWSLKKRTEG